MSRRPYAPKGTRRCRSCRGVGWTWGTREIRVLGSNEVFQKAVQISCPLPCRGGLVPAQDYTWKACDGEAHSNPYIDYCTTCAPLWGWVVVPAVAPAEEG